MVALMTMPVFTGSEKNTNETISSSELSQRVAIIKRFKELLKAQRDRFTVYLDSLEKQKDVIMNGTTDDLLHHVELEEKIIGDIFSIQKVIDPLEKLYRREKADHSTPEANEVSSLKTALNGLKSEAAVRSKRNKELLSKRMTEIRSEIKSLRSNPYLKRRIENTPTPTQIDIRG